MRVCCKLLALVEVNLNGMIHLNLSLRKYFFYELKAESVAEYVCKDRYDLASNGGANGMGIP